MTILFSSRNDEKISSLEQLSAPIWLFDVKNHKMWWANEAGLRFWDVATVEELLQRDFSDDGNSVRQRLDLLSADFALGNAALDTWTLYPNGRAVTVQASIQSVRVGEMAHPAILCEIVNHHDLVADPNELRIAEASRAASMLISTFDLSGNLIAQNPAAAACYLERSQKLGKEGPELHKRITNSRVCHDILARIAANENLSEEVETNTSAGVRTHHVAARKGRDPITGEFVAILCENDVTDIVAERIRRERENKKLKVDVATQSRSKQRTEALLKAFLEHVPASVSVSEASGELLFINQTARDVVSHLSDEHKNGKHETGASNAFVQELQKLDEDVRRTQSAVTAQLETKLAGAQHFFEVIKFPISDQDAGLSGTGTISFDITEKKRISDSLRESEQRLRQAAVISKLGHYIWEVVEDRCLFCSDEHARIHGMSVEEYVKQSSAMNGQAHPDDLEQVRAAFAQLRSGEEFRLEYRIITPDGDVRYVREIGNPIFDEDGNVVREIGTCQDITEQKRAEIALRTAEDIMSTGAQALPVGCAAYDPKGRLQMWNQRYLDFLPKSSHLIQVGMPIEDLVRNSAVQISKTIGYDDPEDYIKDRLASFAACNKVWTYRQSTGRWIKAAERRTSRGGIISVLEDITEQKNFELELTQSAQQRKEALRIARIAGWKADGAGNCVWSSEFTEMLEIDAKTIGTSWEGFLRFIHCEDRDRVAQEFATIFQSGKSRCECTHRIVIDDEKTLTVRQSAEAQRDANGQVMNLFGTMQDITAITELEEKLRQTQRLEAVGQLTGGVAHDFNNLLAVIQGNAELIESLEDERPILVQEIVKAARRGADLTQRLLAFSRKQKLTPERVELGALIDGMRDLLQRTLGATIDLQTKVDPRLWPVMADAGQIENALLNLVLNARDAMPEGGPLSIWVKNETLDNVEIGEDTVSGDHVSISVEDSGTGMTSRTLSRAFEPFFTTKDVGKGSGLGLSMVFGFARQSGGYTTIESEVGTGTTVSIYLPRAQTETAFTGAPANEPSIPKGNREKVLVIEDDSQMLELTCLQLTKLGFEALRAEDIPAARRVFQAEPNIKLVLTDVVLPQGESGPDFAIEIAKLENSPTVIFMSGYPDEEMKKYDIEKNAYAFLTKPFHLKQLAATLQRALYGKIVD